MFNSGYDYIVIRDMAMSNSLISNDLKSDELDIYKARKIIPSNQIRDFEENSGSINVFHNLIHLLYKYRYLKNWNREVSENYFPVLIENILNKITDEYEIIHFEHFILDFNKKIIKEDLDIDINTNTHYKLILRRKNV